MPIRCHAENDGQGIELSQIASMADAQSIRCFFAEQGIAAIITQQREEAGFSRLCAGHAARIVRQAYR